MNVQEKIEIRGINREKLIAYLTSLGGQIITNKDDCVIICTEEWTCTLLKAQTFRFMHSDVPKVFLSFEAKNHDVLSTLLKQFRLKTLRAGG